MYRIMNAVSEEHCLRPFASCEEFRAMFASAGCDGVEVIRDGEDERKIVLPEYVIGCHLMFYSDWVDYYRGNEERLRWKFGSREVLEQYYGPGGVDGLISRFSADMDYAERMGAKYAVFHVSDVSLDECFSYRWEHTDKEVIDASCELLNTLLRGKNYSFELLLENLWWKGFSFTDPAMTEYMLSNVNYPRLGIMLDTGHLMNSNPDIRSQAEGCRYIEKMLDAHGELCKYIRGMHLHQSVSGEYLKQALKNIPPHDSDFFRYFASCYTHVLQIDTHRPFTAPEASDMVQRIAPEYLVHELSESDIQEKIRLVRAQNALIK